MQNISQTQYPQITKIILKEHLLHLQTQTDIDKFKESEEYISNVEKDSNLALKAIPVYLELLGDLQVQLGAVIQLKDLLRKNIDKLVIEDLGILIPTILNTSSPSFLFTQIQTEALSELLIRSISLGQSEHVAKLLESSVETGFTALDKVMASGDFQQSNWHFQLILTFLRILTKESYYLGEEAKQTKPLKERIIKMIQLMKPRLQQLLKMFLEKLAEVDDKLFLEMRKLIKLIFKIMKEFFIQLNESQILLNNFDNYLDLIKKNLDQAFINGNSKHFERGLDILYLFTKLCYEGFDRFIINTDLNIKLIELLISLTKVPQVLNELKTVNFI